MQVILDALSEEPGLIIAIIALLGGIPLGAYGIYSGSAVTRDRERTRREIAAYVAEGTMTPDDAAKLLSAGTPTWRGCGSRR